ncbi:MAG: potassium-transporting ATPase subunit C [Thermoplasmata archaeon]|nr:potassium-transporting ATPase subunit C [Thermoplasmata archaeon]MCI4359269.1 potassium-transporting ATPase subunit C [Thermoplasmata archaeon]
MSTDPPPPPHPHPPPPDPTVPGAVRASGTILVLLLVVVGGLYPGGVSLIAHTLVPNSSGGSLLTYPNGTAYGSRWIGENVTNPALFWPRASLIDYQTFAGNGTGPGNEVPPGPTDPALLNETAYYVVYYCHWTSGNATVDCLQNHTVPIDLVAPSASGVDPDITPAAALVQIPRIAHYSNLSEEFLRGLVNAHVVQAVLGFLGSEFVNVLDLDRALIGSLPPGTGY